MFRSKLNLFYISFSDYALKTPIQKPCVFGRIRVYGKFSEVRYIAYNLSSKILNSLKIFHSFTSYELKIKNEDKS
jgi:hypothetical protein